MTINEAISILATKKEECSKRNESLYTSFKISYKTEQMCDLIKDEIVSDVSTMMNDFYKVKTASSFTSDITLKTSDLSKIMTKEESALCFIIFKEALKTLLEPIGIKVLSVVMVREQSNKNQLTLRYEYTLPL